MKHGEYKVPGGKLVIVDFSVDGGQIRDMHINGDFFLEPADALDALNAALEGVSTDTGEAELAGLLERAIPAGAELIGFSAASIATAVRRALDE